MNIAIAGYGAEGKSNYRYFAKAGHHVTIVDERDHLDDAPVDAPQLLGEGAFGRLNGFDMVVRTAGLAPRKITTDGTVWSATNEFFAKCPAPIIGVTGSKGKGTTCSLITSILRETGRTVHLVGNIGVPALDVLPDITAEDIVVYELSSFQLWDAQASPHVSVVLHIEPDHLDVHADFAEYIAAKTNIRAHQSAGDHCFYHPTNEFSARIAMAHVASPQPAIAHRYNCLNTDDESVWVARYEADGFYASRPGTGDVWLCGLEALKLPGDHNKENATAAISAAMVFTDDAAAIERGLAAFTGLPHRLKFVRSVREVGYYDDSIATTPGSAIAAIRAFEQPKVLILGGSGKGADFRELADVCRSTALRRVLLIGAEAPRLAKAMEEAGVAYENLGSNVAMSDVVRVAADVAHSGDVVVLSPACASFGMFANYADRGDQFVAAVEAL